MLGGSHLFHPFNQQVQHGGQGVNALIRCHTLKNMQLFIRHCQEIGGLSADLADNQAAEPGKQVVAEPSDIRPLAVEVVKEPVDGIQVTAKQCRAQFGEQAMADESEDIHHLGRGHFPVAVREYLIEQTEPVANGTGGFADDHVHRFRLDLDPFLGSQSVEMIGKFLMTEPFQFIALAPGQDGQGNLVRFGGGEHEIHMGWGFLQGLQQGVEGLGGKHVHFVDNDDFVTGTCRQETNLFLQFADFLNTAVRRAVHFLKIDAGPLGNLPAGAALVARFAGRTLFAVQGFGHDAGEGGLAGAPHPAEQEGVRNPSLGQGVLQGADHGLLTDDLGKTLRSGFSGEDEVGQNGNRWSMIVAAAEPVPCGREGHHAGLRKKRIARHPCTHKEVRYRCFLPDLTEFAILYCTGPGYHTG